MANIIIQETKQKIEVAKGQDIRDALAKNQIYIKSSCGGQGSCSDCMIKVVTGEDNLSPMSFAEIQHLGNVFHITKERLSCQTHIVGDVMIDISHHNEKRDKNKIQTKSRMSHKVRKKEEIVSLKEEKVKTQLEAESLEKENSEQWMNHWEKDANADRPKKLGGGRRPKPFLTPDGPTTPIPPDKKDKRDK